MYKRQDYTHKAEYTLINELYHEQKLPNLCTIINGVDLKKRKYGYYYGLSLIHIYSVYGINAKKKYEQVYSPEAFYEQHLKIYKNDI